MIARLTERHVGFDALEVFLGEEVHDARHGVGSPRRGGAAGDDLDALDHVGGDQVEIDYAVGRGGYHSGAIDQRQRASVAEASQVRGHRAASLESGARDGGLGRAERRDLVDQIDRVDGRAELDVFLADDGGRRRRR